MSARLLVALLAALYVAGSAWADPRSQPLTYREPPFTITIPPGFVKVTAGDTREGLLDTFRSDGVRPGEAPVMIQLIHLGAEVPQRALTEGEIAELRVSDPFPFTDHRERARTLGFEVETLVGTTRFPDGTAVLRQAAAVPLDRDSVLVVVLGPASRERESRAVMRTLLASARGRTSWKTPAQRVMGAVMRGVAVAVVTLTVGYAVAALTVFRRRDGWRRARAGVLCVTGALWASFGLWLVVPWSDARWCEALQAFALAAVFIHRGVRLSRAPGTSGTPAPPAPRPAPGASG